MQIPTRDELLSRVEEVAVFYARQNPDASTGAIIKNSVIPTLRGALGDAMTSLGTLIHEHTSWSFSVAHGVTVKVSFSGPPVTKEVLQAFVSVFAAAAAAYVQPEPVAEPLPVTAGDVKEVTE